MVDSHQRTYLIQPALEVTQPNFDWSGKRIRTVRRLTNLLRGKEINREKVEQFVYELRSSHNLVLVARPQASTQRIRIRVVPHSISWNLMTTTKRRKMCYYDVDDACISMMGSVIGGNNDGQAVCVSLSVCNDGGSYVPVNQSIDDL